MTIKEKAVRPRLKDDADHADRAAFTHKRQPLIKLSYKLDGICHIYVDKAFDIDKAVPVLIDAKTQYTAV